MRAWIGGVAVLGPGLPGWVASLPMLAGTAPWTAAEVVVPPPALLAATERRRTSLVVRLALAAAAEATAREDGAALDTIFASSNGDGVVLGAILAALAEPEATISPTQFHNSVHNAAAGYWGIGMASTRPSVSIGGHDDTVATGLLQAVATVATRGRGLLFCAYDAPLPAPLYGARRTTVPFAAALVLRPEPSETARAALTLRYVAAPAAAPITTPEPADALDGLAADNPAARLLPLLRALARQRPASLRLPLLDDAHLVLDLVPC